jgi:hypothetical protein
MRSRGLKNGGDKLKVNFYNQKVKEKNKEYA